MKYKTLSFKEVLTLENILILDIPLLQSTDNKCLKNCSIYTRDGESEIEIKCHASLIFLYYVCVCNVLNRGI